MGDLNRNLLDLSDKKTEQFTDIMFNYNFYPLINKPTRITDSSSSAIDHIWTNVSNTSIKSGIIAHCAADHLPVIQVSNLGKIKTNSVSKVRCYALSQSFPNWGSRPREGSRNKLQGSQEVHICTNFRQSICVFSVTQLRSMLL